MWPSPREHKHALDGDSEVHREHREARATKKRCTHAWPDQTQIVLDFHPDKTTPRRFRRDNCERDPARATHLARGRPDGTKPQAKARVWRVAGVGEQGPSRQDRRPHGEAHDTARAHAQIDAQTHDKSHHDSSITSSSNRRHSSRVVTAVCLPVDPHMHGTETREGCARSWACTVRYG